MILIFFPSLFHVHLKHPHLDEFPEFAGDRPALEPDRPDRPFVCVCVCVCFFEGKQATKFRNTQISILEKQSKVT